MTNEEKYREALEKIANLSNVTQIRGGMTDWFIPDHMIDDGGWVPITAQAKLGLGVAAKIAREALVCED